MFETKFIRNFSIIAHVDHGKSTLADCMIMAYGRTCIRDKKNQMLDSMDLERERGITIKSQSVALFYNQYKLNLLDTPGHADFHYEVTRSIQGCEGVLLVVDCVSGIQAQTVANLRLAQSNNLTVIPIVNKIDLPGAQPEQCAHQLAQLLNVDVSSCIYCSAKQSIGIEEIVQRIVSDISAPSNHLAELPQVRVIDSWLDPYLGITSLVRVHRGLLQKFVKIKSLHSKHVGNVLGLGIFLPEKSPQDSLTCGDIGYLSTGSKDSQSFIVGDTLVLYEDDNTKPLEKFEESMTKVHTALYPYSNDEYVKLRNAVQQLCLNDSSVKYHPVHSPMLGHGFNCGFLGMLHIEVFTTRLEREYKVNVIVSQPTVSYKVIDSSTNQVSIISSIAELPSSKCIIHEPRANAIIVVPTQYISAVYDICYENRGIELDSQWNGEHTIYTYDLPMLFLLKDFSSLLQSRTKGYASFDYKFSHYSEAEIKTVRTFVNDDELVSLAQLSHQSQVSRVAQHIVNVLEKSIYRCQFLIKIQVVVNGKVVKRGNIKPYRKDVTAKCYGRDASRRRKLLDKQKQGKKKMVKIGKVTIKPSVYTEIAQG